MHIILVSDRMATARSITLDGRHLAMAGAGLMIVILALSSMFSYLTVRHAAEIRLPYLQELLRTISHEESGKTRELVRENLATMAARLGQMQGQLMQLDTLGERLAGMAGVKMKDIQPQKSTPAGSGGPLSRPDNLNTQELQRALDELAREVEARSDTLSALESRLLDERMRKNLLPSARPIAAEDTRGSAFGWRTDPFTGMTAMHEGLDFSAEPGTPILSAAAGLVANVERHPHYGNMVDIDHGNGLTTRYAHAQQIFVKTGEFVKRGQRIAAVGSTGRSTGPHLHFEVRVNGLPQNPSRFLERGLPQFIARQQ